MGTCKPRCLHLGGRRVSNMVFVFCVFLRGLIMLHVFPWLRTKYNLDDCARGSRQLVTPNKLWPHVNIPLPLRNPPANYSTHHSAIRAVYFSHLTHNHADIHSTLLTYPTVLSMRPKDKSLSDQGHTCNYFKYIHLDICWMSLRFGMFFPSLKGGLHKYITPLFVDCK